MVRHVCIPTSSAPRHSRRALSTLTLHTFMSATDIAREVIRMATTAGLSKDIIDLMDKKMALLTNENTELKTKVGALEIEVRQLRGQLGNTHPTQQPADTCPFCRHATGELVDLKPHDIFGDHGVKVGYYQCSNCGKKYDKQIRPDA
jgi:hypothetical protein